jgi:PAS domain-containing protein
VQGAASDAATLKTVIDNAPVAIVVIDAQCHIVMTNPLADRLYARSVPFGQDYDTHAQLQLCHPDGTPFPPRDLPLTRSALDGETLIVVDMVTLLPDGEKRHLPVNTAPIQDSDGCIVGAVGAFEDITGRRKLEESLRQAKDELDQRVQERTAELVEANNALRYQADLRANISDAVVATSVDYRITAFNRAAEKLYGWTAEEAVGRSVVEIFLSAFVGTTREEARRAIELNRRENGMVKSSCTLATAGPSIATRTASH